MSRRNTLIKLLNKERTYNEEICCGVAFDRWVNDSDLAIIVDALEKTEKYKWHDLRKNPDDLPKEIGYYLCKVGTTTFFPHRVMKYEPFDLREDGENKWCDKEGHYVYDHFVIKWKYIESFEEVENDL